MRKALLAILCLAASSLYALQEGALPGLFSVSPTKQVYFSRGNAQYNDHPRFAQFAEHQWDFVGDDTQGTVYYEGIKSDNNKCARLYKGWLDLFEWGGDMTQNSAKYVYDTFYGYKEWGNWSYQNGGYPKGELWRTLTGDEWIYLFDKRPNARNLRGQATVNNMHGYILLPDAWQLPQGLTFRPQPNNWTTNTYSAAQWAKMETKGAVFLPAAGVRNGRQIQGIGVVGAYWSSTLYQQKGKGDVDARNIYFTADNANANMYDTWHRGMSVRLVHDADYVEPVKKSAWDEEMERQIALRQAKPQAEQSAANVNAPNGVLPGWFSIGPGIQARFAQGNVQYKPSTNTWRFAEHQYDFVGEEEVGNVYIGSVKCDNTQIANNVYDGWIDAFNWGNATTPTDYKSTPALRQGGKFEDWGRNPFVNGGNANDIWRTLSREEWTYLYDQRANAKQLRGQAMVNGVQGYIFLPDNWRLPSGLSFKPEPKNMQTNVYSVAQWDRMEKAGAVFLPAGGERTLQYMVTPSYNGSYWSSSWANREDDEASCAWFIKDASGPHFGQRVMTGLSVRLVQDRALAEAAKRNNKPAVAVSEQQVSKLLNLPDVEPEQEWKLYEDIHVIGDINPREGFRRIKVPKGSFAEFLRNYKLKDDWNLYYYNGSPVKNQFGGYAVLDIDIGTRDLLQCADAVMLLRAEWLYRQKRYKDIHFNALSGKRLNYTDYVGNDYSYAKFRKYMDYVFAYANTASLEKELKTRKIEDIQIGDVFITSGNPGHAMIVVDMAINAKGERALLFAQGMMPAQSVHVVTNLEHGEDTPWYLIDKYLEWSSLFVFPNYVFSTQTELKCFE